MADFWFEVLMALKISSVIFFLVMLHRLHLHGSIHPSNKLVSTHKMTCGHKPETTIEMKWYYLLDDEDTRRFSMFFSRVLLQVSRTDLQKKSVLMYYKNYKCALIHFHYFVICCESKPQLTMPGWLELATWSVQLRSSVQNTDEPKKWGRRISRLSALAGLTE